MRGIAASFTTGVVGPATWRLCSEHLTRAVDVAKTVAAKLLMLLEGAARILGMQCAKSSRLISIELSTVSP